MNGLTALIDTDKIAAHAQKLHARAGQNVQKAKKRGRNNALKITPVVFSHDGARFAFTFSKARRRFRPGWSVSWMGWGKNDVWLFEYDEPMYVNVDGKEYGPYEQVGNPAFSPDGRRAGFLIKLPSKNSEKIWLEGKSENLSSAYHRSGSDDDTLLMLGYENMEVGWPPAQLNRMATLEEMREIADMSAWATGGEESVGWLFDALKDERSGFRRSAVAVIGRMADDRSLAAVVKSAVSDPCHQVQLAALEAIQDLGPGTMDALLKVLAGLRPDDQVKKLVISALGSLRDSRAIPALERELGGAYGADAALALGEINDPTAAPALLRALDINGPVQNVAAMVLGFIGEVKVIPVLLKRLHGKDSETSGDHFFAETLVNLLPRAEAGAAIEDLLERGPAWVRYLVVRCLGERVDDNTRPFLQKALHDPETKICLMAAEWLAS